MMCQVRLDVQAQGWWAQLVVMGGSRSRKRKYTQAQGKRRRTKFKQIAAQGQSGGVDELAQKQMVGAAKRMRGRITLSSPRWSGPRCLELVAGSRKQVVVVVMAMYEHGNLCRQGHVTRRAAHPITCTPLPLTTSSSSQHKKTS